MAEQNLTAVFDNNRGAEVVVNRLLRQGIPRKRIVTLTGESDLQKLPASTASKPESVGTMAGVGAIVGFTVGLVMGLCYYVGATSESVNLVLVSGLLIVASTVLGAAVAAICEMQAATVNDISTTYVDLIGKGRAIVIVSGKSKPIEFARRILARSKQRVMTHIHGEGALAEI